MPKSVQSCVRRRSSSTKLPLSSRISRRSRANKFSLFMLPPRALFAAASFGALVEFAKLVEIIGRGHEENSLEAKSNSPASELRHHNKSA